MAHDKKRLRTGFTTGTAAAAAVKGALGLLIYGKPPEKVNIPFLSRGAVDIDVAFCILVNDNTAECTVIKDAGDDPDITHNAEIGARVSLLTQQKEKGERVVITGGQGVGRVTKPGLEVPPGRHAINPGPEQMIRNAVDEMAGRDQSVHVEIFVPDGQALSRKTLNRRLGIVGGISILGTTGIVKPMSHEAYKATINSAVRVAAAMNIDGLVFTTGRRSERFAGRLFKYKPEEAFIQIGDFFKISLEIAAENGVKRVFLVVFFGKAVKMAQGVPHTHAAKSKMTLANLSGWCRALTGDTQFAKSVESANTARHAFTLIADRCPAVFGMVGRKVQAAASRFSGRDVEIGTVILDYGGDVVFNTENEELGR